MILFHISSLLGAAFLFAFCCECSASNQAILTGGGAKSAYLPEWADLDTRPLPRWYDEAKVGVFLHWGVYSVPGLVSEWFWSYWKSKVNHLCAYFLYMRFPDQKPIITDFMNNNYKPGFSYQDFAHDFTAEFFKPDQWADIFKNAGAKYVVLTSKHHDGYTLFPSKRSFGWNAVDVGPKRDLVKDLAKAVRAKGMKFGVYHSLYEWFNPIYLEDKKSLFATRNYSLNKLWPDLQQLIDDYEPSILWVDGDWEATDAYWRSTEFLAWLYNESPVKNDIVVNDRWGMGTQCKRGDFYNCKDRYSPGVLQSHKWENAMTIDKESWGYRRNAVIQEILTIDQLLKELITTVSCGGNLLMNIGPTKEGTIVPIFQERLAQVGFWLGINGEAIYSSSPWIHQNDSLNGQDVWYTCRKPTFDARNPIAPPTLEKIENIFGIFLQWPASDTLVLKDVAGTLVAGRSAVVLLGDEGSPLEWSIVEDLVQIKLPDITKIKSKHAWTLKFTI